MSPNTTKKLLNEKDKGISYAKSKIFDLIALAIIAAMSLLSLGFVELRHLSWQNVINITTECIPLYFAATLLSSNYYRKGVFSAKIEDNFKKAIKYYSEHVNSLTGDMISKLHEFCNVYNLRVKSKMQEDLLRTVAITYELYDEGDANHKPLKVMSKSDLLGIYDKNVVKIILKCNKIKIKGLNVNSLLGNLNNSDSTDLGCDEKQLRNRRIVTYAGNYILVIISMSLIGVKDVMLWGWMGAALTLFKVLYIAAGAYMKYFNGYEDIDVNIVNYLYRKTDVIKEFLYWYNEQAEVSAQNVF